MFVFKEFVFTGNISIYNLDILMDAVDNFMFQLFIYLKIPYLQIHDSVASAMILPYWVQPLRLVLSFRHQVLQVVWVEL